MKKILFCMICVLACFSMVNARDISEIKEQWHLELDNYNHDFGFDDQYIYYTFENELSLIDKNTGEQKTVDVGEHIQSMLSHNDHIYVNTNNKLLKFDKKLKMVKSRDLGIYENIMRPLFVYDGKMYSKGIIDRDSLIIGDDLEISSLFKYEDGSFIVMDDRHTYLLNKNEKIIGQFDEIAGYYIKNCIYLNNNYYILSTNSRYNNFHSGTSITTKLRKLDSNFNLLFERDIEIPNDFLETMFVYDNKLILNNYYCNKSYLISEIDLSETSIDYVASSLATSNYTSPVIEYRGNSTNYGHYEFYLEAERHLYSDEHRMINSLGADNLTTDLFRKNTDGEYMFLGHIGDTNDYILTIFDSAGEVIWFNTLFDLDSDNISATFFGEYIAVYLEKGEKGIIIFNRDGDIVHSFVVDKNLPDDYFVELYGQNNGLTLLYGYNFDPDVEIPRISDNSSYIDDKTRIAMNYYKEEIIHYNFDPLVETNAVGEGSINIKSDNYKPGDVVSFESLPKSGYVVSKVIVKDEYGNQIEVNDNSFVMPNADVTIEVLFDVQNPNTSVFIRIGIFVVIMLLTYYFVILQNIKVRKFE